MNLFVDTSVWSLALRREDTGRSAEVEQLAEQLQTGGPVFTTGIVLQELLQGFFGPKDQKTIIERFAALPFVVPDRVDHIRAATLRNECRRNGVQVGTIDALLSQLCIHHDLTMLTADKDFVRIARYTPLLVWG